MDILEIRNWDEILVVKRSKTHSASPILGDEVSSQNTRLQKENTNPSCFGYAMQSTPARFLLVTLIIYVRCLYPRGRHNKQRRGPYLPLRGSLKYTDMPPTTELTWQV